MTRYTRFIPPRIPAEDAAAAALDALVAARLNHNAHLRLKAELEGWEGEGGSHAHPRPHRH